MLMSNTNVLRPKKLHRDRTCSGVAVAKEGSSTVAYKNQTKLQSGQLKYADGACNRQRHMTEYVRDHGGPNRHFQYREPASLNVPLDHLQL